MHQTGRGVFGQLHVRLDAWSPEFGPEFAGIEEASPPGPDAVDVDLETPGKDWLAIGVTARTKAPAYFVDGVRRLEARVIVQAGERYHFGAFGAYGVGAVRLDGNGAVFDRFFTGRILALSSSELPAGNIAVGDHHHYVPVRIADQEPDAPMREVHNQMRLAEEMLARELADGPDRLVVVDGPLTFEEKIRGAAVGYIKRVINPYLPPEQLALLASLQPGERTPIFGLRASRRFSRLSWFLRLDAPGRGHSDFSGIVRLEVPESVGLPRAQELAAACAALLPQLKGRRALDRRAPQNLLPIAALETFLRRRSGDERIARRRIEAFLAREAV